VLERHLDPAHLLRRVEERHVRFLTELEMRYVAHIEMGYMNAELADLFFVTEATARRHIGDLVHKVFDPTGMAGDRAKLQAWTRRHFACCTQAAAEMIENARKDSHGDRQRVSLGG
jgi:DNA-binding CsgD family transcriptional regulator